MKNITVNRLCKLLGVTSQTIHMYEKYGIVNCQRENNNYRIYDIEEIMLLLRSRQMQKSGYSMNTIAKIFNDYSEGEILDEYQRRIDEIDDEISKLLKTKEEIKKVIETDIDYLKDIGSIRQSFIGDLYYVPFYSSEEGIYDVDLLTNEIREKLPFNNKIWMIVKSDDFLNGVDRYIAGLFMDENTLKMVFDQNDNCIKYSSTKVVVLNVKREDDHYNLLPDEIDELKRYLSENNLKISKDILIKPRMMLKRRNEKIGYYQIFVPVI